jgi:hypothetical protein
MRAALLQLFIMMTLGLLIPFSGMADSFPSQLDCPGCEDLLNQQQQAMKSITDELSKQKELLKKVSPIEAGFKLEDRIPSVPGTRGLKNLIRDYREILRPDAYQNITEVGGSNEGILAYTDSLGLKDRKFGRYAYSFYKAIQELDAQYPSFPKNSTYPLGSRPALSQKAGEGRFQNLKPGWLWELALKTTRGDPNEAIRLIGVCGHDDTARKGTQVYLPSDEVLRIYNQRLKFLDAQLGRFEEEKRGLLKQIQLAEKSGRKKDSWKNLTHSEKLPFYLDPEKQLVLIEKAIIRVQLEKETTSPETFSKGYVTCPNQDSVFYVAQSLGIETDVTQDLKNRITSAQAPSDMLEKSKRERAPGSSIPAKVYHIYGAALIACEMISKGHSPSLVSFSSGLLGYAYRSARMNSLAAQMNSTVTSSPYQSNMVPAEMTDHQIGEMYDQQKIMMKKLEEMLKATKGQIPNGGMGFGGGSIIGGLPSGPSSGLNEKVGQLGEALPPTASLGAGFGGYGANWLSINDETPGTLYDEDQISFASPQIGFGAGGFGGGGLGISGNDSSLGEAFPDVNKMSKQEFIEAFKKQNQANLSKMKEFAAVQEKKTQEIRDAIELFNRWTLSQKVGMLGHEMQIPYTAIRIGFPEFLEGKGLDRLIHRKPEGWSDERFERAQKRFKSMIVDFEWTARQHSIGGKFAAQKCKPTPGKIKFERSPVSKDPSSAQSRTGRIESD